MSSFGGDTHINMECYAWWEGLGFATRAGCFSVDIFIETNLSKSICFIKEALHRHVCFCFRNIIYQYKTYNSPIYACYLDTLRAFDCVNHWTLLKNNFSIEGYLWFLSEYWRTGIGSKCLWLNGGSATRESFKVGNGVRQGIYGWL